MNKIVDWYFPNETSPGNVHNEPFVDSKFSIEGWSSFAREIVQNSLDAALPSSLMPVKIIFDTKTLKLSNIPGGERIREIIERCHNTTLNKQAKIFFNQAKRLLDGDMIECLKISDFNTTGVNKTNAWKALVFDEGFSYGKDGKSAGSFGLGKKAPFIISGINTVFYSSIHRNGNDVSRLFQGKSVLANWNDLSGKTHMEKGWFGVRHPDENVERTEAINPIEGTDIDAVGIDDFFTRKNETGTDVIIVGVDYEQQFSTVKTRIINAILDNFFLSIKWGKLEFLVFDVEINKDNIDSIIAKYYYYKKCKKLHNLAQGNLRSYLSALSNASLLTQDVIVDDVNYGEIQMSIENQNEHGKKYYCLVRSHGMKIQDVEVDADQPFSAVVVVRGDLLNDTLRSLETPSHDEFDTEGKMVASQGEQIAVVKKMRDIIQDTILATTKVEENESEKLSELTELLNVFGEINSIKEEKNKIKARKEAPLRRAKIEVDEPDGEGADDGDGSKKRKTKGRGNRRGHKQGYLFNEYIIPPSFVFSRGQYIGKFILAKNIDNGIIKISAVSFDNKPSNIGYILKSISINKKNLPFSGNIASKLKFSASKEYQIIIKLKKDVLYQLIMELFTNYGENQDE